MARPGVALRSAARVLLGLAAGAGPSTDAFSKLPMAFEVNLGQSDPEVAFLARGRSYTVFLTSSEAVLSLKGDGGAAAPVDAVVRVKLLGADPDPAIAGLERLPGISNYLLGNDPAGWRTGIPQYGRVEYREVYPGVDLAFYGDQRALEYDFVISPGADPSAIRLAFEGVKTLRLDGEGNLVLELENGEMVQTAPVTYQTGVDTKTRVRGRYVVCGDCEAGFAVDGYDRGRPLVIDPVLVYSTYLGGIGAGDDRGYGIAVDGAGNAYVTGSTTSADFPAVNPLQSANADPRFRDVFVSKLAPAGSALLYSTYLGGSREDMGLGIAVDGAGSACVTGRTESSDFPAIDPLQPGNAGGSDAFVARLDAGGSALVYSTCLGGGNDDSGYGIAVDGAGNTHVTGETYSSDFPTFRSLQPANAGSADAFAAALDPSGSALVYSTFLGGSGDDAGYGISVNPSGNACVAGYTNSSDFPTASPLQPAFAGDWDTFVSQIDPSGSALVYSTYLGGSRDDRGAGIAVDASGNAYVTGRTTSTDFPMVNALQPASASSADAFVAALNPAGSALVYSTYLGGTGGDGGTAIAVDASGSACVTGSTGSTNFPTFNPLQAAIGSPAGTDAFVLRLTPSGSAFVYSTYLGGSGDDFGAGIAVDGAGNAYATGGTVSVDFPAANALQPDRAGWYDAFVTAIDPSGSRLVYSTYLGGSYGEDSGASIAVDGSGSAYIAGYTYSRSFPTVNPAQSGNAGSSDAVVSKLDPAGSSLIYSTCLGGTGDDFARGIAVDASGNAFVTGDTWSVDFPTANPLQPAIGGGFDAFVAKLAPSGSSLVYSTYLGGSREDASRGIALGASGSAYITGGTASLDFPTASPLQPAIRDLFDAFVAVLDPGGSAFVYSTYLGGGEIDFGTGIAVDSAGNACITGETLSLDFPTSSALQSASGGGYDAFVAMLNPTGAALAYSTYLGGIGDDGGRGVAVDGTGNAYVTGYTRSPDFPTAHALQSTSPGSGDAFVAALNPTGAAFVYSTYLGGRGNDSGACITVDAAGNAFVTGSTFSTDFPLAHPVQPASAGLSDAFAARLDSAGAALLSSTYIGGSGQDSGQGIAVDTAGSAHVTGSTASVDFPTSGGIRSTGVGEGDAFVVKLPGCALPPGRVVRLMAEKAPPSDTVLSWDPEPLSADGYRVYAVDSKPGIPTASTGRSPECAAPAGRTSCADAGGLPPPPDVVYYQVVGVCADGITEGPI